MFCKEIIRDYDKVFMVDSNDFKLEISNLDEVSKYEVNNRIELSVMLNDFLSKKEQSSISVLRDIEYMVKKYNIDYFAFGESADYANQYSKITYNTNNRKSYIDCTFSVFYNKNEELKFIVSFKKGSSGTIPGFDFNMHFNNFSYLSIKNLIEGYFKLDEDSTGEIKLLDELYSKVRNDIIRYYN
ncbi:MAG: hypothetical protein ACRCVJ_12985 [Clostridium sp.]|uniref:hypothetical protein n=1 Tax=Clostridium sp. TaxID=1506 RepID=UPI003F3A1A2F